MLSEYMLGETMEIFKSEEGVIKVSSGNMLPTESIRHLEFTKILATSLRGSRYDGEKSFGWQFELKPEDVVFGLGENMRGMNKRGYVYEAFCSDDPSHTPDKTSLYGAHNFLVVVGKETYGIYVDSPSYVKFDIGFDETSKMKIAFENPNFDLYFFEGDFKTIVNTFRKAIGLSYVPPKWGFGYQQSRWSYEDHKAVRSIVNGFKEHDIPCDAVYLDIDYMERFKDFTISQTAFPEFDAFVKEMADENIKLVPIIDAGVKVEEDYDVYEEGIKNHYFVTDADKKPFVAAVWPGLVHFPDFLNSEARQWFGEKYHFLLAKGIRGFWNDMNEPAIFYSQKGLEEAFAYAKEQEGKNLDIYTFFGLKDKFMHLSNAESDYKSMYHNADGRWVNHYDVHNLYGYNMTRSAYEGFQSFDENMRVLMITRASHIGMAKYSGIWTGDNCSWWEHLKLNIQMMPSLSMAGFLYAGADTGGFGSNTSAELLTRWIQFSLFTPLLRNHSALGTRRQEPWAFDDATTKRIREAVRLRYALIPYLYSEFMKANLQYEMLFAPLAYVYSSERSKMCEDQLLLGNELMLAPIYEQNSKGRFVYLPEDMLYVPLSQYELLMADSWKICAQGDHFISVSMDEIPLFIRKNKMIPFVKPANRTEALDTNHLKLIGFVPEFARYELYEDDGETQNFVKGDCTKTVIEVRRLDEGYHLSVETTNAYLETVEVKVVDENGLMHTLSQKVQLESTLYV